jgi:hypothetical protein
MSLQKLELSVNKPYFQVEQTKGSMRLIFNYDDDNGSVQHVGLDGMYGNAVYRKISVGLKTLARRIEKGIISE